MKNKYGFILVKPQLGENIGACARSMKNFGFSKLHIVSPKFSFPNHKTKVTSVGAFDIINKTKETRISINCRFKGLFTPYAEKKLGKFFSPLNLRPASQIGLKYKFPGE